ncbi:RNA/RNP complex-1-interacting phosphatase [Brienomyrus brachyistius]|uniref:RNA/RNP complex-1-interacting phosphatase n=1 Tax=Brienomyrus brachyistius TaxID=42636 RepID=UPI0020B3A12B|nr:RNA/RNP complex-1-interacting phosphatase [Brienomyrus brachyistius]
MAYKKKRGIPDRWTDYQALGKRIPGTRFIAFKVPLQQSLIRLLPASEAFGPLELLRLLEEDKEELGLIIDLTFTTRYYKSQDLPSSVHYLKIYTAGHEVPSDSVILSFKRAVQAFLRENKSNDRLIGVHCTHGLNRTGYLVCRYLIDVDGMDPGKAIELFNRSRGHSIERENYLQDLCCGPKRSNQGMEDPDQEPVQGKANPRGAYSPRPCPPRDNGEAALAMGPHHDYYMPPHQTTRLWGHPSPLLPPPGPLLPMPTTELFHYMPHWGGGLPFHSHSPFPYPVLPRYSWSGPGRPFPPLPLDEPQKHHTTGRTKHRQRKRH